MNLSCANFLLESIGTVNRHRTVDSPPSGGGPGMVLKPDVAAKAIDSVATETDSRPLIYLTPRGKPLTQQRVRELASGPAKPREFEGRAIPEVLLSGDHKKIAQWRRQKSEEITKARRPDTAYKNGDDHERD